MMILLECFVFLKTNANTFYNQAAVMSIEKPYFKNEIQLLKIIERIFQTYPEHVHHILQG